jgi:outer membrane protein assembly factor BamE (lipoprotein component of BamABCDE complex)
MVSVLWHSFGRLILICMTTFLLACEDGENWMMRERNLAKLTTGVATEEEIVRIMGTPADTWFNPDSTRTLSYPMGPEGIHTWMVTVSIGGILQDREQVLTDAKFQQIPIGATREEVRRILGKPKSVVQFKRMNEEVWDWKYRHVHEDRLFNVHFDMTSGKVVRTSFSEIFTR